MEVAFHWFDPDSSMQHSKLVNAFLIEIAVAERKKKSLSHSGEMYRLIEKSQAPKGCPRFQGLEWVGLR